MSQRTLPVPFPLKRLAALAPSFAALALSACVAPVGPVEVTRFHAPDTTRLGRGTIRVEPAPGQADGLEFRTYASAVAQELTRVGYTEPLPGQAAAGQVALLTLERNRYQPQRSRGPVSVGVGGATGGYGSGAGLGIGFDLSGAPKEQVETRVFVSIRDRNAPSTATALWEGRAAFVVRSDRRSRRRRLARRKLPKRCSRGSRGSRAKLFR
ncbi:DUF4136 domain-containing protein [Novosphingobium panipatense]|uniref:DUF4136 domain-containing protein n=1 Tax=Novosphingobium panipatense TaxID=428991 RepID=UPI00361E41C6